MKRLFAPSIILLVFGLLTPASTSYELVNPRPSVETRDPFDSLRTNLSDYLWPTDASRTITSTFGEYRRTHFHGGIDISTHDRTGYRVFASRDGYVSRITISPTGYGKILYLRHTDGYTTTYAHLKGFAGSIEDRAVREQTQLQQYPVDIRCAPGELPVRKGDTIAFTGETGTGSPHLHFEVRDENMNPVNPFLCPGVRVEDTMAPEILRVAFSPLSPDAQVDGIPEPRSFRIHQAARHSYRIPGRITLSGRIGVSVDVRDRSNGSRYRQGAYGHDLYLDGTLLYSVRMNRVSARDDETSGLFYDWDMQDDRSEQFERLYLPFPFRLPLVNGSFHDAGVLSDSLPHGEHVLRIVSVDFNGNSSELTASVSISRRPTLEIRRDSLGLSVVPGEPGELDRLILSTRSSANGEWNTQSLPASVLHEDHAWPIPQNIQRAAVVRIVAENRWGNRSAPAYLVTRDSSGPRDELTLNHECTTAFVRLNIGTKGIASPPPTVILYEGNNRRDLPVEAIDLHHYSSAFVPDMNVQGTRRLVVRAQVNGTPAEARDEFELFPIVNGSAGSITADSGNIRVEYDTASVHATTIVRIQKEEDDDGTIYSILPDRLVLKGSLLVSLRNLTRLPKTGMFFHGRSGWRLLTASSESSPGYLSSRIWGTLGDVAVFTDTVPPTITRFTVTRTHSAHPIISFRIHDDLAGIEYESLKMYIDDIGVIPEIDGEHHRARFEAVRALERGPHRVTIRLHDLLGNSTTAEHRFVLR